jgi:flagellar biogenesis protein FliO
MDGGAALATVLRTLLSLIGVCALAWAVLTLLARRGLLRTAGLGARPGARLAVLERVSLSPRRTLYLVRADARVFLMAAGEAGPPALIAELEPEAPQRTAAEAGVREVARAVPGSGPGPKARDAAG